MDEKINKKELLERKIVRFPTILHCLSFNKLLDRTVLLGDSG